jgi:acetyl esterase
MREFVDTPLWNRSRAELSWKHYLGSDAGGADVSVYAVLARAHDLSGLPAAYISVCEFDPLRDEGMFYAQRLMQAGVHTELHLYPGTFHASVQFAAAAVSQRMHAEDIGSLHGGLNGVVAASAG